MRYLIALTAVAAVSGVFSAPIAAQARNVSDVATVRRALQLWYDENKKAYDVKDLRAIMALRTEDFHAVTPDSVTSDRAAMEERTQGLLNGINRWISQSFELDSITVSGDLASAVVRQHIVRMALRPDGLVHHVETWVTQRETWRKTASGWKLYRVDNVRDQRRLVDGK